jgi:hypothetical protein
MTSPTERERLEAELTWLQALQRYLEIRQAELDAEDSDSVRACRSPISSASASTLATTTAASTAAPPPTSRSTTSFRSRTRSGRATATTSYRLGAGRATVAKVAKSWIVRDCVCAKARSL